MRIILAAEPNTVDKIEKKIVDQEIEEFELEKKALGIGDLKTYFSNIENKLKAIRSNLKLFEAFKTFHYSDSEIVEVQCYQSPMIYFDILEAFNILNKNIVIQVNKRDNPIKNYSIFFKNAINKFETIINKEFKNYEYKTDSIIYKLEKLIPNIIFESGSYQNSHWYLQNISNSLNSYNESKQFLFEAVSNNKNSSKIIELIINTYEDCLKKIFSKKKYIIIAANQYNSLKEHDYISALDRKLFEEKKINLSDEDQQEIKYKAIIDKFIQKNTNLNEEQIRTLGHILYNKEIKHTVVKLIQSPLNYFVEPLFQLSYSNEKPLSAEVINFIIESPFFYKFKKLTNDQIKFIGKYTSPNVIECFKKPFTKELSNLPANTFEEYEQSVNKINNFIINAGNVLGLFKKDFPALENDEKDLDFKAIVGMLSIISKKYFKWFPDISQDLTTKFFQDAAKVINKYLLSYNNTIESMVTATFLMKMMEPKFNIFKVYLKYCLCGKDINYLSKELTPYINLTQDLGNADTISQNNRDKFQLLVDFSKFYSGTKIAETKIDAFFNNLNEYAQIIHSAGIDEIKQITNLLISTNVKIDSQAKKQFIQFWSNDRLNPFQTMNYDTLEKRLDLLHLNSKEFGDQYKYYLTLFENMKIISGNDIKFVQFFKTCSLILSMESYQEYLELKKPKNEKLFDLNYKTNNYSFRVLDDMSIEYFSVGIDTHCCQVLGGYGHDAAVDSFINPVASVLILDDKEGNILSQSYFHYVPEDNGFILDNVETNSNNINKAKIDINSCYAELGKYLKEKYDIKYFRCGLEWNKLDSNRFAKDSDKVDKRHFEGSKYSDYDPKKFLDLLNSSDIAKKPQRRKNKINQNTPRTPEAQQKVDERNNYLNYKKTKQQSPFGQKLPLNNLSASVVLKMLQKYGIS